MKTLFSILGFIFLALGAVGLTFGFEISDIERGQTQAIVGAIFFLMGLFSCCFAILLKKIEVIASGMQSSPEASREARLTSSLKSLVPPPPEPIAPDLMPELPIPAPPLPVSLSPETQLSYREKEALRRDKLDKAPPPKLTLKELFRAAPEPGQTESEPFPQPPSSHDGEEEILAVPQPNATSSLKSDWLDHELAGPKPVSSPSSVNTSSLRGTYKPKAPASPEQGPEASRYARKEPVRPAPAPTASPPPQVIGHHESNNMTYTLYSDGSIEVVRGDYDTRRFTSLEELKEYMQAHAPSEA